jgi:hypothetical protein
MSIQIKTLQDKDLERLGKKIEEYQNNNNLVSKGSLPFFNTNTNEYGIMMFFPKLEAPIKEYNNSKEIVKDIKSNKIKNGETIILDEREYKPSEEQLKNWARIKPSDKQLWRLDKLGIKVKPTTMLEAFKILSEQSNTPYARLRRIQ